MPLEHFKTQVLLLHSEQRTLDALSAGFNDRYAVHCATSGTEALNIFGDTPIHVIVSAQNLPGMSGVDALREAKKRSPETIAILLAGTDAADGLEALVSDKEVFQIVRGEITPEALENLIDSATKSVRLLALSEASNDTAANVDEPHDTGEHIVMETAENGSFIISDGTGTLPVLNPGKVQISPHGGSQAVEVLVLTQDEEFLNTVRESSRGLHNVHHVVTPNQAEEVARTRAVGVLVTDAAMIGSNIEELTQRLRTHVPRLVAIVAGRRDDGELLMDLINRGKVYRFLLKPVSPGRARLAIEASVKHHLEGAETAFKPRAGAPGARQAAPTAKPPQAKKPPKPPKQRKRPKQPKPAAQPAPPPTNRRAPSAARRTEPHIGPGPAQPPQRPVPQRPVPPTANPAATGAHRTLPEGMTPGLDDAFDEAPSFTETVAGLAVSVGKSLSSAAETVTSRTVTPPPPRGTDEASGFAKYGKVAAGGIAVIGLIAVVLGLRDGGDAEVVDVEPVVQSAPAESATPAPEPAQSSPPPAPAERLSSPLFEAALQQARDARAIGNIYIPAGENAVEYYLAALDLAPDDAAARSELDELLAEVFNVAETALLENRSTDASQALRVIFLADPENPRLTFLNAQLAQQQFRQIVVDTRAAIRDARFEDAAALLAQAQATGGADSQELDALNAELTDARSEQRLDDVLQAAAARLNDDQLIAPPNDNARYYYQLALNSDPGNAAAAQGLISIASKLVLRSRTAIDEGNYAVAESLLAEAEALDPDSDDLRSSVVAVQSARNAEARAAAEAERLEAERLEAERLEAERQAAAREAEAARIAAERAAAEQQAAAAARTAQAAVAPSDTAAPEAAPRMAAVAAAAPRQQPEEVAEPAEFVSISALERTKYVAPRYPRSAQRRNASGYVDVAFTVTAGGTVEGVEVTDSRPGELFNEAAVEAVEQWEFAPVVENGAAVEKRVAVRLSFALE